MAPSAMNVRVVSDDAEFDRLAPAWDRLLGRADSTVFQTHEWLRTWWRWFGRGKRLLILVFELEGEVEGIAPMFTVHERLFGIPVATRLQFIGVDLSDYLGVIAARGREAEVHGALAGWLSENRGKWDVIDLEDVAETSASFTHFPAALEAAGMTVYHYQGSVCPRVSLPKSEEALMRQLGATSSYNLKRKSKRLKANFRSSLRLISRPEDPIEEAVRQFAVIHGGRWKSQGHPSAFDDPNHVAFHVEACRKIAGRGWLRMFFLDIEDAPAAVCFSFNYGDTIYMYQSNAHGSDEVMKTSPGLLVRAAAMTDGITEGMRVFDFMRGNELYKYREWAAFDVKNWLLRASSPGSRAKGFRFTLFLAAELAKKAATRIRMEYYDFRRYQISGQADEVPVPVYAMEKTTHLLTMTGQFITRHLPVSLRGNGNTTDDSKRETSGNSEIS